LLTLKPNIMKTLTPPRLLSGIKFTLLAVLVLTFSCSPEPELNSADLDATQARSRNKNDKKSLNAELRVLVKGAPVKGSNGLDVGPDGNLYIASVNGQEVVVMNKNNGKILNKFGTDKGVLGPDDLVFNPEGTAFYFTDLIVGFVGRMSPDGVLLGYQEVSPGVNPVRFSKPNPDDPESVPRLFVALDFLGDGLYELDPDFTFGAPAPSPLISCPTGFCMGFFNSFDTRWEDGRLVLYGPLFAANLIVAIDVTDITETKSFNTIEEFFADETTRIVAGLDGSLSNPAAAKFGPDGMLYVIDQSSKLFKVDPDGLDQKTLVANLPPGLDNITFDDDGSLYMTNADEGWVAEVLPSGQLRYISPGGMILPQGLAVMPGANNQDMLFEADLFRLRQFNGTSGRQENTYKGFLINPPTLDLPIVPMNIKAAGDKLLVTSWFSGGVQLWDLSTNPATVVPGYTYPMPVPIDAVMINGDIIVSDYGLGGVVYASNFAPIKTLGAASGLATDGETLWAADQDTGDIWEISFDSDPKLLVGDLKGPEGIALDNEGGLLVVEADPLANRLSRIDLETGDVSVVVEGLKLYGPGLGVPPTWGFDGVAVGASGDIYVSGAGETVIYKIK
jgi:sugar lactone lactonase YvrE